MLLIISRINWDGKYPPYILKNIVVLGGWHCNWKKRQICTYLLILNHVFCPSKFSRIDAIGRLKNLRRFFSRSTYVNEFIDKWNEKHWRHLKRKTTSSILNAKQHSYKQSKRRHSAFVGSFSDWDSSILVRLLPRRRQRDPQTDLKPRINGTESLNNVMIYTLFSRRKKRCRMV